MDFVSNAIARPGAVSRRIECLTVADDSKCECVDITADFGIGGAHVTRLLNRAATFEGYPKDVRTDNRPKFTALNRQITGDSKQHSKTDPRIS